MGLAAKWAARMAWTSGRRLRQERRGLRQVAVLEALVELLTDGQREAGDLAVARRRGPRERGIVFMRGHDNRNGSRLKSYGRILNGFYVMDVDSPGTPCLLILPYRTAGKSGIGPLSTRSNRDFFGKTNRKI